MADDPKTPVAIRITRPYVTETEFLEREFDTLTRTSVILLGAQSRPQGVVLRFEIVLKGGESIVRGEGRVVGYKDRAYGGEPGLSLRFTRLDARSKALVDRASALRDARVKASSSLMSMPAVVVPEAARPAPEASGGTRDLVPPSSSATETSRKPGPPPIPQAPPSSRRGPPPLPEWASQPPPPVADTGPASSPISSVDVESTQVDSTFHEQVETALAAERPKLRTPLPPPLPARARLKAPPAPPPSPTVAVAATGGPRAVPPPGDREALLHRLRARRAALPAARVQEILSRRP